MNAERLKEIKERWAKRMDTGHYYTEHGKVVGELVAEVERLQIDCEHWRALAKAGEENKLYYKGILDERDSLAAKLAVAREALKWYAEEDNYYQAGSFVQQPSNAQRDGGYRATEALARIDGDGTEGKGGVRGV